ncbi:MAG: hypothetical protein IJ300_12795 [Clostridia bacterium]|nr:hypothetical protein [Clostridia bacterium]
MSRVIGKTFPTKRGKNAQTKNIGKEGTKPDVKAPEAGTTQDPPKEEK